MDKRNTPTIDKEGKIVVGAAMAIAIFSSLALSNPFAGGGASFGQTLIQSIPLSIGITMLIIPIAMYYSLRMSEQVRRRDEMQQERLRSQLKKRKAIAFRAFYRKTPVGTEWAVYNTNKTPWEGSTLLIERTLFEEKSTEVHPLGTVGNGDHRLIPSQLEAHQEAKWRVLVVTPSAYKIDLPQPWRHHATTMQSTLLIKEKGS